MLRKLPFLFPLVVLLLAVATPLRSLAQKTITVNGNTGLPGYPYPTIQSGIDAAVDGDTVLVIPIVAGSYNETIDFKGKAITVTGRAAGADPTATLPVMQSSGIGPSVVFQTGETSSSVFSYFNIQAGGTATLNEPFDPGQYTSLPGAIYVHGTSPSILNNTLSQSACLGVYVEDASPLIQGNTISGTTGGDSCGEFSGQAITILSGSTAPTRVIDNILENNVQVGTYTAIGFTDTGPGGGGAISVNAPTIIQNNIIRKNNSNASWGGGINIEGGPVFIVQNLIYGNSSNCGGGAIALPQQGVGPNIVALIANNTMVDNLSGPDYDATCPPSTQIFSAPEDVLEDPGPNVVIVNNILSGSTTDPAVDCSPAEPPIVVPNEAYQSIFDHNILRNVGGSFFGQYCVDVSSKYGNLTLDPQFNSPSTGDYSLTSNSPAIDAGNTSALQLFQQLSGAPELTTDFDNNPRVIDSGITGIGYPIIDIGAYEYPDQPVTPPQLPTTMVLSFEDVSYHYSLTATTQSPLGVPVGDISFFVDGAPLGSAEINASGIATLSGFPLVAGTHALSATYPGHDAFTPAIAVINIANIPLIQTDILIGDNKGGQAPFGTPVTFTVTASALDGSVPMPVTLTDLSNNTLLVKNLQFDASGVATFTTSSLYPPGSHPIQAAYAGSPIYAATSDTDNFIVTGYLTTLNLTCGPSQVPVGTPVPLVATVASVVAANGTPTGEVAFKQGITNLGQSALANGVAQVNTVTVPGNNSFTAIFDPQNGFDSSSATCNVYSPALTVSSSANPTPAYTPITFTANLAGTPITGSYTLTIGSNSFPMTASSNNSSATYTTSGLAQGTYNVTATFAPANNATPYVAYLEPPQLVTASTGDFTLTGPSSLTTRTESTASGTLALASINYFQGTVALTCSLPLPTTYTCTISPTSIPLAVGGTGSATVTLSPTLKLAANPSASRILFASLFPLTLISLAGFFRRRKLSSLLPLAILAILAASTTACGKDIYYPATPPGSYPFTITATGTTKGATTPTTHTLNITLILTP